MVAADEVFFPVPRPLLVGSIDPDKTHVSVEIGNLGVGIVHDRLEYIPFPLQGTGQLLGDSPFDHHLGQQLVPLCLGLPPLGDIKPGADDVFHRTIFAGQDCVRPGDQAPAAIFGDPLILVLVWVLAGLKLGKYRLDLLHLFRQQEKIPEWPAFYLRKAIAGALLACPVETHDAAIAIEHHHQGANRIEHGIEEIKLSSGRLVRLPITGLSSVQHAGLPFQLLPLSIVSGPSRRSVYIKRIESGI